MIFVVVFKDGSKGLTEAPGHGRQGSLGAVYLRSSNLMVCLLTSGFLKFLFHFTKFYFFGIGWLSTVSLKHDTLGQFCLPCIH